MTDMTTAKWKPYPEFWPPKSGFYFICADIGGTLRIVQISYFDGFQFDVEFQGVRGIVAWMPIECPETYSGPDTIDMHPDAVYARQYMKNRKH